MANITVQNFSYSTSLDKDTILVEIFGNGTSIRTDKYSAAVYTLQTAEERSRSVAESLGVTDANGNIYEKASTPEPQKEQSAGPTLTPYVAPPPPANPPPPPVPTSKELVQFAPSSKVSKPKSAREGEFVVKETGESYKGFYVETYRNKYKAGSSLEDNGVELVKVRKELLPLAGLSAIGLNLLLLIARGILTPTISSRDRKAGVTKRYFAQDKKTNKITEIEKSTYDQAITQVPNVKFAEVDWVIQGPAEDTKINNYPVKGAATKNKQAIQALEKQIPGISTFVKDYALFVQEPIPKTINQLSSQTIVEKDPQTQLDNDRKANFDLRK